MPAMQKPKKMWICSLDKEDPLEEGMAMHSSILAWRISMDRGTWQAIVHGVAVRYGWATKHNKNVQRKD